MAAGLLSVAALAFADPTVALASPDCSNAGPKPSAECAVKLEYCVHTSIVLVLAVRARESGMKESDNFAKLMSNDAREPWYAKYREIVKSIVHQTYSKEQTYQKLRARIAPSAALAVAAITDGCNADKSISVDTK